MDLQVVLVGLAALSGGGLVWLSATSATEPRARRGILVLAVGLVGLFYLATADLLGRPKPVEIEAFEGRLRDTEVLAHHLRQGEAIYLWVAGEEGAEPVAYRMPWIEKTARDLHAARQQAESEGTGSVRATLRAGDGTDGGEPTVGWVPPPADPPKYRR